MPRTNGTSLFERALGAAFEQMPRAIRELHRPHGVTTFDGIAEIEGAANLPGALAALLFRFPRAGREVPVEVTLQPHGSHETWQRRFGRSRFSSVLAIDARTEQLTERFGPVRCRLTVACHGNGLDMHIVSARLLGAPLPRFLTPWTQAYERIDAQGRFAFDVEIGLPVVGRLVRYRGWLLPKVPNPSSRSAGA
jgi:hypothetical protein